MSRFVKWLNRESLNRQDADATIQQLNNSTIQRITLQPFNVFP